MCGIAGCFAFEGRAADAAAVLALARGLEHRGPDSLGLYEDAGCALAAARLAVFDLETGDQPCGSAEGRFWLVQNGAIYNHVELRGELEAAGRRFVTRCDTEVLLHALLEWGDRALARLEGAFALALYDRLTGRLLLARDRFGIRPLHLRASGGRLWFASEPQVLALLPGERPRPDPRALVETFVTWGTAPERSFFTGIEELPPGSLLEAEPGGVRRRRSWWRPFFPGPAGAGGVPEDPREQAEAVAGALERSVAMRLRADVPVAVYLSGGLDSSYVAALAAERAPIRAFSLAFSDGAYDESAPQERVAQALGLEREVLRVSEADVGRGFAAAVRRAGRPILRTAPAPLLALAARVRAAGFKVVLTGEGADELFAGYEIFKETAVRRFWARRPDSRWRPLLLRRLYPYLASDLAGTGAFLVRFFARHLDDPDGDPLFSHRVRFANTARCLRFVARPWREAHPLEDVLAEVGARLPAGFEDQPWLGRARTLEILTFFEPYLLHAQGDRMLAASGLEARFPFLGTEVFSLAARLPARRLLFGLRGKKVLREAAATRLPADIAARPKRPYRAPIHRAFFGAENRPWVEELLSEAAIRRHGLFEPGPVRALRARGCAGEPLGETDEMALCGLLSAQILAEWLVSAEPATPRAPDRWVRAGRVLRRGRGHA